MTFDLSQFELNDTATLTVQNAAGTGDLLVDGNPVQITVYGPGSTQGAAAEHRAVNAATARMQAAFRGKAAANQSEENEGDLIDKLTAITQHVENFPIVGGPRALYENRKLVYIRDQVAKYVGENVNFSKDSAKS